MQRTWDGKILKKILKPTQDLQEASALLRSGRHPTKGYNPNSSAGEGGCCVHRASALERGRQSTACLHKQGPQASAGRGVGGRRTPTVTVRAASQADRRLSCAVSAWLRLISASKAEQAAFSPAAGQSWQVRLGRRWHHIRHLPQILRAGILVPCQQWRIRTCHAMSPSCRQGEVLFVPNVLSNHAAASCLPFSGRGQRR